MTHFPNHGFLTVNLVDVVQKRLIAADIVWQNGKIAHISNLGEVKTDLPYLLPGLVDAHVHIESSMLTPCEFARIATRHGTVASVSDPHEIANVLGLEGIEYMLTNAAQTPFKICFGAPSCVPATVFETAGATLTAQDLHPLFAHKRVGYLSEVMNYVGVLTGDKTLAAKLDLAKSYHRPLDGHAPGLSGDMAQRYANAGISTDHECSNLQEALDKLAMGMKILIREGSAARNFEALHSLISTHPKQVMLCSDDKHPDDLQRGHINQLVARALAYKHDLFNVLQAACVNPVQHYQLPVGLLQVGDPMDALLVNNLQELRPLATWINGQKLAENGTSLLPVIQPHIINCFHARPIQPDDFKLPDTGKKLKVIKVLDGQLLTEAMQVAAKNINGMLTADIERDLLWLSVVNRYQPTLPAIGFIHGFGLRRGALASSFAHDSHNIIAVAADLDSLCLAVNTVIAKQGGLVVTDGEQVDCLPLPIAGLISDQDGDSVAKQYAKLDERAKCLGSTLHAPLMSLSFMGLLVIPELKLSDLGLFDGTAFELTNLFCEP